MQGKGAEEPLSGGKGIQQTYIYLSALYVFIYYGFGAFFPLMSQYYKSIHLTGTEIGTISSITPIVSILAQPIWGMICDRYSIRKPVLIGTLLSTAAISLLFSMVSSYAWILFLFTIFSVFQCALVPISDSIALSYAKKENMQFGNIRMWGAVGFAVAVFFTGIAVEKWGPNAIFYCFAIALIIAMLSLRGIPDGSNEFSSVNLLSGLGQLLRLPRFLLFLISSFFIFGAINANNIWFSLYYQHIGGSVSGIGLAFLLFAGSEAPFMKIAASFTRRFGMEITLLLAGTVSAIRWLWYGTAPSTTMILCLFFIQGISAGFYLANAAQFVRENTPPALQVTALALFTSLGYGLGSMANNLLGGIIMDRWGILSTYTFFGVSTLIGLIPLIYLTIKRPRKALSA
ncbi:MFS transporter [Brevibacillus ginsengisoli]|uniref:MFS transporter n=1 Tax=Brevibacillus ginsengisoli TaxID=363854 RepID=UPI003CF5E248